jgi:hypothetical protein
MPDNIKQLRIQLKQLRARYDSGAIPPGVYAVIRELEQQIAWLENARSD